MNKIRQNKIKAYIEDQKVVTIKQLQELFPNVSLMTIHRDLDALAEAGSVVIVAVAEDDSIQRLQIHAQTVGIVLGIGTGTAVKQDTAAVMLHIKRQPMLCDQSLVFRGLVVHQGCDM